LPILPFEKLESEAGQGRFRPVYLLFGPEAYLMRRAISLFKEHAIPQEARSFNVVECSGENADAAQILAQANTYPMMSARRLVLVTEVAELPEADLALLAEYARTPQPKTVLVLVAGELDRRGKFYRSMAESACVIECARLKGAALERWADALLARRGLRISPAARKKLVDLAGTDMISLANEIEKLILYAGQEKTIPDAALDLLVQASRLRGIFEITSAVGRKDVRGALHVLGSLLESGENPLGILGLMARHFRQVLIAQELLHEGRSPAEIGRLLQIPEFALMEFLRQVRAVDAENARNMYRRLARTDRRFKSTSSDERMVLEHLICSL
jgi:DNA polymerase-3 subunit delta